MEKITPVQFSNWKKQPAGKLFFGYLKEFIVTKENDLNNVPMNLSQEDMFKFVVKTHAHKQVAQEAIDLKVDDLQREESDEV